jgi:mannose-6-phosphate isomerase-like protein (cupin superfamily)
MIISDYIDMTDTMYPSFARKVNKSIHVTTPHSTTYGYVLSGCVELGGTHTAQENEYFCVYTKGIERFNVDGEVVFFTRIGFKGQNVIGGPLEKSGSLCYIDGCSDSLLVYPPRQGDPSLNALFFPAGIDQTFHIHPSIRFGVVVDGEGFSNVKVNGAEEEVPLKTGDMFCIEERETHRFRTTTSHMTVVPYHPDGDWGPTDHNHTMLNRTYITK